MFEMILPSWLIRAAVLLVIGWILARAMEKRSAATAHRLLVLTFAGCLLLPLLMLYSPSWKWHVPALLDFTPAMAEVPAIEPDLELETESSLNNQSIQHPTTSAVVPKEASNGPEKLTSETTATLTPSHPQDAAPSAAPITTRSSIVNWDWRQWLLATWLLVSAALITRFVISIVYLRRHIADCGEAPDDIKAQVLDAAGRMGFKHSPNVVVSPKDAMPMACWLTRPTLVLPENFCDWPAENRAAALAHELGHLARRDAIADYLVQFVACFMWVNPLTWRAIGDVRRLRERACDQWALTQSGILPVKYAQSLLAVVECCNQQNLRLSAPMASPRGLESRLSWLLSSPQRRPLHAAVTVAASICLAFISVMIAASQPTTVLETPAIESVGDVTLSQEPAPASPSISVEGRVVDKAGQPLPEMNVVLRGQVRSTHQYCNGLGHYRDVLAKTKTDAEGKFSFSGIGVPPRMIEVLSKLRSGDAGAQLLVWGPGKAITWEPVSGFDSPKKEIQVADETKFSGTILGPDGKPLDGASIRLSGFSESTTSISAFLGDPGDVSLYLSELNFQTSVRQGTFSLPNLPANKRILLWCVGPAGERGFPIIDTGKGTFKTTQFQGGSSKEAIVHRSPAEIKLEQLPMAKFRIVDHNGKTVNGGGLEAITSKRTYGGRADVDDDGTATLIVNEAGMHNVRYVADPLFPAIGVAHTVDFQTDPKDSVVEFKLPEPIYVEGKVLDSVTSKPIVGCYVSWGNRKFKFTINEKQTTGATVVSNKDGVFRIPMIAGEHVLGVPHELSGYIIPRSSKGTTVEVDANGAKRDVTIKIGHGLKIKGVVTDAEGRPQAGRKVMVAEQEGKYRKTSTTTDEAGRYELSGLSPKSKMRISTWTQTGAAYQLLPGRPDHLLEETVEEQVDLKVVPGTSLSGRVVQNGNPVEGVTIKLKHAPPQPPEQDWTRHFFLSESVTDKDGKYRVSGLRKGESYSVEILAPGNAEVRDWQHGSPYIQKVRVEDGSNVELPDAVLMSNTQQLKGVVVDRDGNPVAGYTVSASLADNGIGMSLSRPEKGPPPWTKTDKNGVFHLAYLPDEPISLMTYKANPAGGRIRYPTTTLAEKNDMNIRIVVDTKLGSGIEDLD